MEVPGILSPRTALRLKEMNTTKCWTSMVQGIREAPGNVKDSTPTHANTRQHTPTAHLGRLWDTPEVCPMLQAGPLPSGHLRLCTVSEAAGESPSAISRGFLIPLPQQPAWSPLGHEFFWPGQRNLTSKTARIPSKAHTWNSEILGFK